MHLFWRQNDKSIVKLSLNIYLIQIHSYSITYKICFSNLIHFLGWYWLLKPCQRNIIITCGLISLPIQCFKKIYVYIYSFNLTSLHFLGIFAIYSRQLIKIMGLQSVMKLGLILVFFHLLMETSNSLLLTKDAEKISD